MSGRFLMLLGISVALIASACSGPEEGGVVESPPTAVTATAAVGEAVATQPMSTPTEPPPVPSPLPSPSATPTLEPTATPAELPPPATEAPTSTPIAPADVITVRTVDTTEPIVALTFDAGADRGFAEQILDTLRDEGVVATFGMTGQWAEDNPDLIERIANEGHQLMNHTMSHRSWTGISDGTSGLSSADRALELQQTEDIVRAIAHYELAPYFRPPYGDYDDSVIADLAASGYSVNVMWTVDSLGWKGLTADEITSRIVSGTVPGAIHLFHVGAQSQDAAALPDIIHQLLDQGYRFVTVREMLGR